MEKIFGYCLLCNKEQEINVENTIVKGKEIKYEGSCKECGGYICLVVRLFKKNLENG